MRIAKGRGCTWATVDEYLEWIKNGTATKRIIYLADQTGIDFPTREMLVKSAQHSRSGALTNIGQSRPLFVG